MDGTLVDSGLDFRLMRREMGLAEGQPILETLEQMSPSEADRCREILARHELAGAERATIIPGVVEFLGEVDRRGWPRAVLTRNTRPMTLPTLDRLGLHFDPVVTRDDAPAKPDPTAIEQICAAWRIPAERIVVIGDFLFDVQVAHRAGSRGVLFTRGRDPEGLPGADEADFLLDSFEQSDELLDWLAELG
jgi:HAD superfamily hydrolase (TIGR01549 family)